MPLEYDDRAHAPVATQEGRSPRQFIALLPLATAEATDDTYMGPVVRPAPRNTLSAPSAPSAALPALPAAAPPEEQRDALDARRRRAVWHSATLLLPVVRPPAGPSPQDEEATVPLPVATVAPPPAAPPQAAHRVDRTRPARPQVASARPPARDMAVRVDPASAHSGPHGWILIALMLALIAAPFLITAGVMSCNTVATPQHAPGGGTQAGLPVPPKRLPSPAQTPPRARTQGATTTTSSTAALLRPAFERGVVTPQWSASGFSSTPWRAALPQLESFAHASWVEMPVLLFFRQVSAAPLAFAQSGAEPGLASVEAGIATAHAAGLRVFLVPLISLSGTSTGGWIGSLTLSPGAEINAWFATYWAAWQPFVAAAARSGAEQVAVATEWARLAWEPAASAAWSMLLARAEALYPPPGRLTYDMNWTELHDGGASVPAWETAPALYALGVSCYFPLSASPQAMTAGALSAVWQGRLRPMLDRLAAASGKPLVFSEVGYRATSDAGYDPWMPRSPVGAASDQGEQAAALSAVLGVAAADPHVVGSFLWGWRNTDAFDLASSPPAQAVVAAYYGG